MDRSACYAQLRVELSQHYGMQRCKEGWTECKRRCQEHAADFGGRFYSVYGDNPNGAGAVEVMFPGPKPFVFVVKIRSTLAAFRSAIAAKAQAELPEDLPATNVEKWLIQREREIISQGKVHVPIGWWFTTLETLDRETAALYSVLPSAIAMEAVVECEFLETKTVNSVIRGILLAPRDVEVGLTTYSLAAYDQGMRNVLLANACGGASLIG